MNMAEAVPIIYIYEGGGGRERERVREIFK